MKTGLQLDLGINLVDKKGNSALHLAFMNKIVDEELITALLLHDPNLQIKNHLNKDAFTIAAENGHWSFVLKNRLKQLGNTRGKQVIFTIYGAIQRSPHKSVPQWDTKTIKHLKYECLQYQSILSQMKTDSTARLFGCHVLVYNLFAEYHIHFFISHTTHVHLRGEKATHPQALIASINCMWHSVIFTFGELC